MFSDLTSIDRYKSLLKNKSVLWWLKFGLGTKINFVSVTEIS